MVKKKKQVKLTDILKQVGENLVKGIWYGMGSPKVKKDK